MITVGLQTNRIVAISGPQGCGKTTALTNIGWIAYHSGKKLYSSYHVNFSGQTDPTIKDYIPVATMDDIKYMKGGPRGGVWLADELYQWLFSRSSSSDINKSLSLVLMVARKRNISIYYTCHHLMHVDVMLRRVSTGYIVPQILPVRQVSYSRVVDIAQKKKCDPHVLYKQYIKELKKHPECWKIVCDVYDDYGRQTNQYELRDIPFWGNMFDTTEEVSPLDQYKKPEFIKQKGLEQELLFQRMAQPIFDIYRVPHSGRDINTHADFFMWPKNNNGHCYLVDVCSVKPRKTGSPKMYKTGLELKDLLNEAQKPPFYEGIPPEINKKIQSTRHHLPLAVFHPFRGQWWVLPVEKHHYYLDHKSRLAIGHDMQSLIMLMDDFLTEEDKGGPQG